MSDYRDPNDPMYRNTGYEPAGRGTGINWGWIAGAMFLVIVLALAFGVGHEPSRVASNNPPPPQTSAPAPSALPGLTPPPSQPPNRP
jgi:hypothetical protein